ncbi:efflux RND transporter permease subunit [Escherichia coli]
MVWRLFLICSQPVRYRGLCSVNIKDPLSCTAGVGSVQLFSGSEYAMRIWLDPQVTIWYLPTLFPRLGANNQISGGQLGGMPQAADQPTSSSCRRVCKRRKNWQILLKSSARWFASAAA